MVLVYCHANPYLISTANVMTKHTTDKDEVLRKVGRNVVALQKMEGMLKKLVTLQWATISVDDQETFHRRTAAIAKRPLGHLVSDPMC